MLGPARRHDSTVAGVIASIECGIAGAGCGGLRGVDTWQLSLTRVITGRGGQGARECSAPVVARSRSETLVVSSARVRGLPAVDVEIGSNQCILLS